MLILPLLLLVAELKFTPHSIATDLKGGYQVVVSDINHDGKPDLIALASGMPDLVWFQNPNWERHIIVRGMTAMINLAVAGNAIVVADHFANDPSKSQGHVYLLEPTGDVNAEWTKREIDRIPSSHRLRTMMLDGKPVVINAPLADPLAVPPDYRGHIPLVFYRPGVWKRESISTAEEGVMHGIFVSGQDLYTASFLGIHAYRYKSGSWTRREITKGDPAPWPKSGSSDVAVTRRLTAAIEPWHGNQVVVYAGKKRQVIDTSLKEGHTIALADFDQDGRDEILAGDRGVGGGVFLWRKDKTWVRQALDGPAIRANSCAAADLNGDGRIDIACIGGATANLVWYENK